MDTVDFLLDIASDLRHSLPARRMASEMVKQWRVGVVPAPNRVRELRKLIAAADPCGRLEPDGSCVWLRRHAKEEGLRPPEANEKAYCKRREIGKKAETFLDCAGYIKRKPDEG